MNDARDPTPAPGGTDVPADVPTEALAAVARWRAEGGVDAARLAFIGALARRSAAQTGAVRQLLDARLARLIGETEAQRASAPTPTPPAPASATATRPLAALVESLARQHPSPTASASLGGPTDLRALELFRSTWTRLSAERRLTESLARVPLQAGPLNSLSLVHRTLAVLRSLSPGYLDRFLDYGDTLMWLERVQPGAEVVAAKGARPASVRARGKGADKGSDKKSGDRNVTKKSR